MDHDIRWTIQKIDKYLQLIEPYVYRSKIDLDPFRYFKIDGSSIHPPELNELDINEGLLVPENSFWGEADTNFILQTTFQAPPDWQHTALYLPIGSAGDFSHPEALVYIDSTPYAAVDRHHQEVILPGSISRNTEHTLTLYGWTGSLSNRQLPALAMGNCSLVEIDQPTRDFLALARIALGIAEQLDKHDPVRASLLTSLNEAINMLDIRESQEDRFYASVRDSHNLLRENIDHSGNPLSVNIFAAGHAHIDLAWLWTIQQARRKAGKTFYNVIRLMEQFPEYHFSQSQAQLYDFVRQDYPELFALIKQRIRDGQWEPLGMMWVESDCNITGGESLVRQLLLGRTFFKDQFGDTESKVLWLPDVFGFPWSLPQLIKEAGLDSFFTIKIGWSQYNRLPYDSFWWQGLDGSRILTHFSTTKGSSDAFVSIYNSAATPDEVLTTWKNFQQKDLGLPGNVPPLLMVYGYGDGGGGPTREMIENLLEMREFPGAPRVQMGIVSDFFDELKENFGQQLPTWNDELYLEYHRGTYTTQARNKWANRKCEVLLHNTEFAASIASLLEQDFYYPQDELDKIWKLLCLNQFHDILPGTSIGEVYLESQDQYQQITNHSGKILIDSLKKISEYYSGDLLVINPISFYRSDPVVTDLKISDDSRLERPDGTPVTTQKVDNGVLLDLGELAPYSIFSLIVNEFSNSEFEDFGAQSELQVGDTFLENKYVKISLNNNGDITSFFSKELNQEIIPEGEITNQFQAYEDRPITPDAWEIDIFYDDKMWLAEPVNSMRIIEHGPLRAGLEFQRKILNSTIRQKIFLYHNSPQIIFETDIDWQDRFILLKVAFPVQVLSPSATFEIQWGEIKRPTHRNTSWDWAKFEVPAHKWVDLSEGGYGLSLLNDCKYGFDVHENIIRMTLLRSPSYPDPKADAGHHRMTYSLLPHGSDWRSKTIPAAYTLNYPHITYPINGLGDPKVATKKTRDSFFQVDQPNVVIETIKKAEDGNGLIMRLFENQRRRCKCTISTAFELTKTWRVNFLEENLEEIAVDEYGFEFEIKPFQILSFRLIPA